jgi:hypothetical protein
MLLTAGCVALGLMLVGMVASATAVHLDRKQLYDVVDLLAAERVGEPAPCRPSASTQARRRRRTRGAC